MPNIYRIELTTEERQELTAITESKKRINAEKVLKARALLLADESDEGSSYNDKKIIEALGLKDSTLLRLRQRVCEVGPIYALDRKPQSAPSRKSIITGEVESQIVKIACSEAPDGRSDWTLRLIAGKLIELEVVESISHETVRTVLKKNDFKPWLKKCWCIPPKGDANYIANMEDVLDVYQRPRDPKRPLVCLDEFCKQIIADKRTPLPAKPGAPERYDYQFIRKGTVSAFMLYAPLEGCREIVITEAGTRTKLDYAEALRYLSDEMFPDAEKIILVEDNLNTHNNGALYAAFEPEEAQRLAKRFERHYTPKHGSWLNIAESEISAITRTGLTHRIDSLDDFKTQCKAATRWRNENCVTTNWQFTCEDSRIKLKSLYPSYQS